MTEPNMRIEISLSDETIQKVANVLVAVFLESPQTMEPQAEVIAQARESLDPVVVASAAPSILDDLEVSTGEPVVAVEVEQELRGGIGVDTDECGFIEGRESKKLRIDNKANTRMGETYWCQKPAGHAGKHTEGWPVAIIAMKEAVEEAGIGTVVKIETPEQLDAHLEADQSRQEAEIETTPSGNAKTNPEGRTRVIGPSEGAKGGVLVARLAGYINKDHDKDVCGWWLPAGASYGKFCAMSPGHSDSTMPGDHTWLNPAPPMNRS